MRGVPILGPSISAADQNVRATLDHQTHAPAMHVLVIQSMRGQVVDKNGRGALDRNPGVGAAASCMHSRVGHSHGRLVIHQNIGRPLCRRTDRSMRTAAFTMYIHGHLGLIANPCLRLHDLTIVTQLAKIQ